MNHQTVDSNDSNIHWNVHEEKRYYDELVAHKNWRGIVTRLQQQGERLLWSGELLLLQELLDILKKHEVDSPDLQLIYGKLFSMKGEWDAALQAYSQAFSPQNASPETRVSAWLKYGGLCFRRGEIDKARESYQQSYEYAIQHQYSHGEVQSLHALGYLARLLGDLPASEHYCTEALDRAHAVSNDADIADSLIQLGNLLWQRGDIDKALAKYSESLVIARRSGDRKRIASSLEHLGFGYRGTEKTDKALASYEESYKLRSIMGDKRGLAACLNQMGETWYAQRVQRMEHVASTSQEEIMNGGMALPPNFDDVLYEADHAVGCALDKYKESLDIFRQIGDKPGLATALDKIGFCLLQKENTHKHALPKLYEGFSIREELGDVVGMASSLQTIGFVYFYVGKWEQAIKSYRKSLTMYQTLGYIKEQANIHTNFGKLYHFTKDYRKAFTHLFLAHAMNTKAGFHDETVPKLINFQRDRLKPIQCLHTFHKAIEHVPDELKAYISLEEFISKDMMEDTTLRQNSPKIGRNDPCPCGSGKKYKKCCG